MAHQDRIRFWVAELESVLKNAATSLPPRASKPTLSDYPLLSCDYETLDSIVEVVTESLKLESAGAIEDILPCSSMQEGILVSQARRPELYNYRAVWKLASRTGLDGVDVSGIDRAIRTLIARHQALRTFLVEMDLQDATFLQVVLKTVDAPVTWVQSKSVEELRALPVDIHGSEQLPYRFTLSEVSAAVYCVLDINHAIIDGMSVQVLVNEMIQAYDNASLPPAPLYSDFVGYLHQSSEDEGIAYWQDQLGDMEPCHFQSLDASASPVFQSLEFELDAQDNRQLRAFCAQHDVTLANLISAVWAVVLHTYAGKDGDQVCFGFLASGRDVPVDGAEAMVGPLIAMLIQTATVEPSTTLLGLVKAMQEQFLSRLPHQHTSLAKIQQSLGLAGKPLFNTLVNLQRRIESGARSGTIIAEEQPGYDPNEVSLICSLFRGVPGHYSLSAQHAYHSAPLCETIHPTPPHPTPVFHPVSHFMDHITSRQDTNN